MHPGAPSSLSRFDEPVLPDAEHARCGVLHRTSSLPHLSHARLVCAVLSSACGRLGIQELPCVRCSTNCSLIEAKDGAACWGTRGWGPGSFGGVADNDCVLFRSGPRRQPTSWCTIIPAGSPLVQPPDRHSRAQQLLPTGCIRPLGQRGLLQACENSALHPDNMSTDCPQGTGATSVRCP